MSYIEEDYKTVHDSILSEMRLEKEHWEMRLAEQTEKNKKDICRTMIAKIIRRGNKIRA